MLPVLLWALVFVGSLAVLVKASYYFTDSAERIGIYFGISPFIIGVTIVAVGTSAPELAIGNVLGSNIFNALGIMGISALFGTLAIPETITSFVMPMMIVATLLYFVVTWEKKMTLREGWMLAIFYIFFLGKLFGLF